MVKGVFRVGMLKGSTAQSRGGFLPTNIANLELWLDADDEDTITEVANLISQWDDKSGNGNDVAQATEADQPTFNVGALNNVELKDTTDILVGSTSFVSPYTVFAVYKHIDSSGDRGIISGDGAADGTWRMGRNGGSRIYDVDATRVATNAMDTTNFVLYRAIENGSTSAFFINGVDETDDSAPLGDIGIFSVGQSTRSGTSQIQEIIIYERELTSGEITQVENYLNDKWSI